MSGRAPTGTVTGREYHYVLSDVFSGQVFAGNPLAVFPDAAGLDARDMQRIAREFNLSETVFMFPARSPLHTRELRIFTPAQELAFAGHPTIGAAVVLAELGGAQLVGGQGEIVFGEGAGAVPVVIRRLKGGLEATLTAPRIPERGPEPPSHDALARMLSLPIEGIFPAPQAALGYSAGEPFLLVRLRDVGAVSASELDPAAWKAALADWWAKHVYPFAIDESRHRIRARMFGPELGIVEDPATGSAAAALAGYIAEQLAPGDGVHRWTIEQGIEMGRPSTLHLELEIRGGALVRVCVGGGAVIYGHGVMQVPGDVRGEERAPSVHEAHA